MDIWATRPAVGRHTLQRLLLTLVSDHIHSHRLHGRPGRPTSTFATHNPQQRTLKPHKVPNVAFARFGNRHMVRLFLPGLYDEVSQQSSVSYAHKALLYDKVIRPAVAIVDPLGVHDWPASYANECFRAKTARGGVSHGTKGLGADVVFQFGAEIRRLLRAFDWGADPLFMVQIQGAQGLTIHALDSEEPDSAFIFLQEFTRALDTTRGQWWIDVALEFVDAERALLWRSDAHHIIVGQGAGITAQEASQITRSSRLKPDPSSHLTALAGFRTTLPADNCGPYGVTYMQAYTTDKSQTFHPSGFYHSQTLSMKQAQQGEPPQFMTGLIQAYRNAGQNTDVAVRLEVRVPIESATEVLQDFSQAAFCNSVVSMPRRTWW